MENPFVLKDLMMGTFVLLPAAWTVRRARAFLASRSFTHVVVRRTDAGPYYYLFTVQELQQALQDSDDATLLKAFDLHESSATPTAQPGANPDTVSDRAVILAEDRVVGFYDSDALEDEVSAPLPDRSENLDERTQETEPDVPEGFVAYPALEAPPQVAPAATFTATVGFREKRDASLEEGERIEIFDATSTDKVLVILSAEGATVPNQNYGTLPLDTTATISFSCTALADASEIILKARYFFDAQIVGVAKRRVLVTESSSTDESIEPEGAPNPCRMGSPTAESLVDLTITVTHTNGSLEWDIVAREPRIREGPFREKISDAKSLAAQIDKDLRPRSYRGRFANNSLRENGQRIADKMPSTCFDIIREVHDALGRIPRVLLLTDEEYIPWELALFREPLLDEGSPPFLAAQTFMGRWWIDDKILHPPPEALPINLISAVASKYGLGSDQRELKEALKEREKLCRAPYNANSLDASLDDLQSVIFGVRTPGHLIHFAVHGYSRSDANEEAIILADGQVLRPGEIVGDYDCREVPRFSFFFFNACQVGTAGSRLGQAAGFPGTLVRGGARGFIAPLWEVHDTAAREFAEAFYKATLCNGRTVADVLREHRSRYNPSDTTTPMAYIYYGHPALRLQLSTQEEVSDA